MKTILHIFFVGFVMGVVLICASQNQPVDSTSSPTFVGLTYKTAKGTQVTISSTNIDVTTGTFFTKTLSANTPFIFQNMSDGITFLQEEILRHF